MDEQLNKLINKYPELSVCASDIERAFDILAASYRQGGQLLLCGNGGSAADCEHIVGELMKGFTLKRPVDEVFKQKLIDTDPSDGAYMAQHLQQALPAISLVSHSALMTAFVNDVAADMVFAQQVYGYGKEGDVLIGLSTSGNSDNVLKALKVAKAKGMQTIGFTGRTGGKMKAACDTVICVPWDETLDIQERHLPIYHTLCMMLEREFFLS
ncbi:D-sedoheptulose-7-phosphate isomerase [Gracilibacillus alcaliphilus]|uniref:D-sedoheptulose-7-phosphate isomerase n=1 Tax=Gracilibacillus alcaliphilus TaxID=1401441 RepID=UPI00195E32D6|nr:SIS domain-containing protein [Gracilibacillus alcaliphilus]MBM7677561.1 D-sedoheptulose 7-phosphate isomerase [Gracilibacillus alcaliphilus]